MLRDIWIENFKPFGEKQHVPLAPITLVYGPNSSGKSSIIQSLVLLRQSAEVSTGEFRLIPRGDYIDLGSYRSLIFKHDQERHLKIGLSYDDVGRRRFVPSYRGIDRSATRHLHLDFGASELGTCAHPDVAALTSVRFELTGSGTLDVALRRSHEASWIGANPYLGEPNASLFEWEDRRSILSYMGFLVRDPRVIHQPALFPDLSEEATLSRIEQALSNCYIAARSVLPTRILPRDEATESSFRDNTFRFIRGSAYSPFEAFNAEFVDLVDSVQYLGPLRSYPERHYLITGGEKASVGSRGQHTSQMIYRGPSEITDNVNSWFKTFGIPYAISIKQFGDEITGEVIALHLLDQRSLVLVGPSDVGFGIGQLLPVIVQGLVSTSQSLCVEQPEIHLHPKLQASLADFFIASSGLDPNRDQARSPFVRGTGNQWIIETHSEALVLRLQKRIREHAISCEDVCVLYVLPGGESGSRVLKLRLDEDGEFLDTWPEGFFEESFTEIFG